MKNGYDHRNHQNIYTYNLSVPKRFTLDVPAKSPPNQGGYTTVGGSYMHGVGFRDAIAYASKNRECMI